MYAYTHTHTHTEYRLTGAACACNIRRCRIALCLESRVSWVRVPPRAAPFSFEKGVVKRCCPGWCCCALALHPLIISLDNYGVVCMSEKQNQCTVCSDGEKDSVKPVDVVITGLNTILPLMTEEILKVPHFHTHTHTLTHSHTPSHPHTHTN